MLMSSTSVRIHRAALAFIFTSLLAAQSVSAAQKAAEPPHMDLEMTAVEYRALMQRLGTEKNLSRADPLQPVLNFGKRAIEWVETINRARPAGQQLELTNPQSTGGIPIDQPSRSNQEIVLERWTTMKAAMPAAIRSVLEATSALPATAPLDDEAFITQMRLAVRSYEHASRWLLQVPYLSSYAARSRDDIRGYYFLSREPELEKSLRGWTSLTAEKRAKLSDWLAGICHNGGVAKDRCLTTLQQEAASSGSALAFYQRFVTTGKQRYDAFFRVQNPRPDGKWTDSAKTAFQQEFLQAETAEIQSWLTENIEDEWRFGSDFQLRLKYSASGRNLPRVIFEAGATPHVNGLGGAIITMDANRSIQEYSVRWTIRHEFGHVLGFPDCYIEFFDPTERVMINYQIDLDNLMCSRRGHIQAHHVDEFRRAYR